MYMYAPRSKLSKELKMIGIEIVAGQAVKQVLQGCIMNASKYFDQ